MMKTITIAGQHIQLRDLSKKGREGLWLEIIANFKIMQFEFNGRSMLLLIDKNETSYSPIQRRKISERIESVKNMDVVFFFDKLLTYERDRLVNQGVYFIVSDKYAFVPTLIINRKTSQSAISESFYPSTQYILFYHLQVENLNGLHLKDLEARLPYKYKTIAKSLKQLESLKLVLLEGTKNKKLVFEMGGKILWEKSLKSLINPIKRTVYSSEPFKEGLIGGISALSHYSMIAPEDIPTRVLTSEWVREHRFLLPKMLPFVDFQPIEIWKYPPLGNTVYVDKLSLYLTLKEDNDPRVEKELEIMMNQIKW